MLCFCVPAVAQPTEFTYQGRLVDGSLGANGTYEMRFRLFDAETGGTQQPQPTPITLEFTVAGSNPVTVSNGVFTVRLDFSNAAFPGAARFLEISVRRTASDPFTVLDPRQPVTSAPHNIKSLSSGSSDGLSVACVLCVTDGQIQSIDGSKVTGTVASAANATIATNVSGVVQIANGGTGSSTKNFVDLSTNQTSIGGDKTFTGAIGVTGGSGIFNGNGSGLTNLNGANITNNTIGASALSSDTFPNTRNLSLLGQRRWDLLGQRIATGGGPTGIAFDGTNIWVANGGTNNVTKIRASDGAVQGLFAAGAFPQAVEFDGSNIWVVNGTGSVTKLRASDGACVGTCNFAVGFAPSGIAFDGANIWVANTNSNNVTKLRASDGAVQGTFPAGTNPRGIAFDGTNIWIVSRGTSQVIKLRASDGSFLGIFAVGVSPNGITFDGANIWVTNASDDSVTKLRASDGACVGICTFTVGDLPSGVAFYGANIWVANFGFDNVTKLRATDGALQGTFAVGTDPNAVAFDGANMWVANNGSSNVTKLPVFP